MRIVIKIGTSTITHPTGRLNIRQMEALCKAVSIIPVSISEAAVSRLPLSLSIFPIDNHFSSRYNETHKHAAVRMPRLFD